MKRLNLFRSRNLIEGNIHACTITFENIQIEKKMERRSLLQTIAGSIIRRGVDTAVASEGSLFDLVVLAEVEDASKVLSNYSNLRPTFQSIDFAPRSVVERAWQNRVRVELLQKGLRKVGSDSYTPDSEIFGNDSRYKKSLRVQASIIKDWPSVWVDPKIRIMTRLDDASIELSESMGEESTVRVQVLPSWISGTLVGRTGKVANEMVFSIGDASLGTVEYWRRKHRIDFVRPDDEMLKVYVPLFGKVSSYPRSCVFLEFNRNVPLPEDLKIDPSQRLGSAADFVHNYLSQVSFGGISHEFEGPISPPAVGYQEITYPSRSAFEVTVGSGNNVPINNVHQALKKYGPYSGGLSGKLIVVHSGDEDLVRSAVISLQKTFLGLKLGQLELATDLGNAGLVDAKGSGTADYASAIAELRTELVKNPQRLLALVVLPRIHSYDVYYSARGKFFERLFGTNSIPTQAVTFSTMQMMSKEGYRGYPMSANIASQCYVKFGGTGTAVWILKSAADGSIPGIFGGSSCYAYYDVSRRPKIKASATAYSALTDSYGRYIATGTRPVGGERLTPETFYDILTELILKVAVFTRSYGEVDTKRRFVFRRLVFAKDGVLRDDEAEMMEDAINNGLPGSNREPIANLLKRKRDILPENLTIDIIGVNKSPAKRVVEESSGALSNVTEGTGIAYNGDEGILVSSSSAKGTLQPIEISLKAHISLNAGVPRPSVNHIMDEYYRLTHLNWSSIFRQGKYALPQILTQNLGENISYGIHVPDDMVLL